MEVHSEEIHSLCRSHNKARTIKSIRTRWAGHVARMEEYRSAFEFFTGNPTGKRPLGKSRRRWVDNVIIDLKGLDVNMRNWTDSDQEG